jgi:putative restriction endonuclease
MSKAVFITKVSPDYDDLPEIKYHFPHTYLNQVQAAVGDWIIYYEPRRTTGDLSSLGGRQAYFATAQVTQISIDQARGGHYYAHISNFLEFDHPVPFVDGNHYYESALRKTDGSTNKGAFGRAVRILPDNEYDHILAAGFAHALGREERPRSFPDIAEQPETSVHELAEEYTASEFGDAVTELRPIVQQLITRPFRDRAFTAAVKSAYGDTCAVTKLKIINGGGRSEVQAAHIRPVAFNGPDSIRNGIALSGTIHWMFDRGLISMTDDYDLLISRNRMPEAAYKLLPSDGKMVLPTRPELRPHPTFLRFHRENVFKS